MMVMVVVVITMVVKVSTMVVKVGTSVAKQASPVRPSGRWVNSCHSCVKMWVGQPFCWCYQFNCDLNLEIVNPRLTSESTWSSPSHHRQPWVRDLAKKKQKWMGLIVKGRCTLHRPTNGQRYYLTSDTQEVQKFSSWPNSLPRLDLSSCQATLLLSSTFFVWVTFVDAGEHLSAGPSTLNSHPTLSPKQVKADRGSIEKS